MKGSFRVCVFKTVSLIQYFLNTQTVLTTQRTIHEAKQKEQIGDFHFMMYWLRISL
ncbi:Hypothetical protein I595_3205 [Croceitalea dokdonensis DOKDO 023]|uniref:Uncharacterized protein n=1 Tax=Croceitalea dokdonensis DOKDO 023 TaxID=1300341 RepID=A0A0N8H3J0_9FLAO|nr:Hypothetical protein I595_3205 [Croceitalea dokdonensis DOKDO 023]